MYGNSLYRVRKKRRAPKIILVAVIAAAALIALWFFTWAQMPQAAVGSAENRLDPSAYNWNYNFFFAPLNRQQEHPKAPNLPPEGIFSLLLTGDDTLAVYRSREDVETKVAYTSLNDPSLIYDATPSGSHTSGDWNVDLFPLPPYSGLYRTELILDAERALLKGYGTVHYLFTSEVHYPVTPYVSASQTAPGQVIAVYAENAWSTDLLTLSGDALKDPVRFVRGGNGQWALFAFDPQTPPGMYDLQLKAVQANGQSEELSLTFEVLPRRFPRQDIVMEESEAALRSEENFASDEAAIGQADKELTPTPLWDGPFTLPLRARITTQYGNKRYVNGVFSSFHSGIDYAAPEGTPVHSSAGGKVVFAGDLIISGKTVIVDHGMGLSSRYCHLHEIRVQKGDPVDRETVLGTVGNTGFSTGNHLHWQLVLHGVNVDPSFLMEEDPSTLLGTVRP